MTKQKLITNFDQIEEISEADKKKYRIVFGDRVGIINGLLRRYDLSRYEYSIFQSLSARTKVLFSLSREVSSGGLGINNNARYAFHACMGETLERYCMTYSNIKQLVFKSYKEIPNKFKVKNFALYSTDQYQKNKRFANPTEEKIYWDKINSFFNPKRKIFWPASLIYLPFEHGKLSAETTSTGVSAHTNKSKAIMGGLLEVIERDALMLNFLLRLNPPEIQLESIKGANGDLITKLKNDGYKIKIYKLISDIDIPIYAGLIWTEKKDVFHYGIGACAALDSKKAIGKTLQECLFTYLYSKDLLHLKQSTKGKIVALYEHFLYYQGDRFPKLLFKSKVEKYKNKKVKKQTLCNILKSQKLEVYYKELTTPDIKSTSIRVFRVIIPGLLDINKSHLLPRLGALRLWTVPQKLGIVRKNKISPLPHPFP